MCIVQPTLFTNCVANAQCNSVCQLGIKL